MPDEEGSKAKTLKKLKYFTHFYWIKFLVFFAIIEILLFTILSPVKNFISTGVAYIGLSKFFITASWFIFGIITAFILNELGLLWGGIIVIAVIVILLFGPNWIESIFKLIPGGEAEKFGKVYACMLTEKDTEKCMEAEEKKPEAKLILEFQPIEIKFGRKLPDYTLQTLRPNIDRYHFPITVTNPNLPTSALEGGLTIKGFYIESEKEEMQADMKYGGYKIMCGEANKCTKEKPCSLSPSIDTEIYITFNNKEDCKTASDLNIRIVEDDCTTSDIVECIEKDEKGDIKCSGQETCLKKLCEQMCKEEYPCVKFDEFTGTYDKSIKRGECSCVKNENNFADLCCEDVIGDEVKIRFYATHDFFVEGIGEFKVAQTEEYLTFQPKTLSGAGPLVVTVTFNPQAILLEEKDEKIYMVINLRNKDEERTGHVDINNISINQVKTEASFIQDDIDECLNLAKKEVTYINSGQTQEVICPIKLGDTEQVRTFATIEIRVDIDYSYTWLESKTFPIEKKIDPKLAGEPGYCTY